MTELLSDNVLTLLVGIGAVVSMVVIAAILLVNRLSKTENKLERRKTSHVTEVLQVSREPSSQPELQLILSVRWTWWTGGSGQQVWITVWTLRR